MFTKILIANRGEIACRVIRTARRMGIATVAVYSDADRNAMHVEMADEAVHIGPAPARESYLVIDRIIDAAQRTGAQAIHPGYGFLSENAAFARRCEAEGLVFIGPPVGAIEAMGSKSAAKSLMEKAGVPLVPGYHGDDQSKDVLQGAADAMGYPVLLKAAAGGGGKGMRRVDSADEFDAALAGAMREAAASFGDQHMLVEKYLLTPRHVEIQVFCDNHGNGVYLFERDCSMQRRHQKVVEEAPAPGISPDLRQAMGEAGLRAAQAINYRGAGTVEFLLDRDGQFYFMEMNTRLQVEHPVTEMITGQDLVEWQLRVAAGQALPCAQEDLRINGHAIEVRIYAESPEQGFLPQTGCLDYLAEPECGTHVRIDSGVRQGDSVTANYDPMISKLIVWDETREMALSRLHAALSDTIIEGLNTNLDFLYRLTGTAEFRSGDVDTNYIDNHLDDLLVTPTQRNPELLPMVALSLALSEKQRAEDRARQSPEPGSPWHLSTGWRMNQDDRQRLAIRIGEDEFEFVTYPQRDADGLRYKVVLGEQSWLARGHLQAAAPNTWTLRVEVDGHRQSVHLYRHADNFSMHTAHDVLHFSLVQPDTGDEDNSSDTALNAPMNGVIVTLLAEVGSAVTKGSPLLVMEAMKMEHTIHAPSAGVVKQFHYAAGELVDGGALLLDFEAITENA